MTFCCDDGISTLEESMLYDDHETEISFEVMTIAAASRIRPAWIREEGDPEKEALSKEPSFALRIEWNGYDGRPHDMLAGFSLREAAVLGSYLNAALAELVVRDLGEDEHLPELAGLDEW